MLLASHGFRDIAINLYHLPHLIRQTMGDGSRWGVRFEYFPEPRLRGTAGAVRPMAPWLDGEPFLVYYGDNLTNFDLTDLWRAHRTSGALGTIGLLSMDDPTTRGIVRVDAEGRIRRWIEKPRSEEVFPGYLVNGGVYALQPEIISSIPDDRPTDFAQDIFPALLDRKVPLRGHRMRGDLLSTDTPERYAHALRQLESGAFALPGGIPL